MKQLWPPNKVIERELFEPSDQLIKHWVEEPSCLDKDLIIDLENSVLACEKRRAYLSARTASMVENIDPADIITRKMPAELASVLQRRRDASRADFSSEPKPGQIRLIEHLIGPDGPTGIDLASPLAVLLFEPTENPAIWYGYGVSPETDYAGYWDLVLEDGVDTPFDPIAGMVQVWNPVHVLLSSSTERVLAQLSDGRLAALSSLVHEYLFGEETNTADADPGTLALRWLDGHRLLTGTPLGGKDDPRYRYQQLYHATFEAVRATARELLYEFEDNEVPVVGSGLERTSWLDQLAARVGKWADDLQVSWTPAPDVAIAMSAPAESSAGSIEHKYNLNNRLLMKFVLRQVEQSELVEVHLALLGKEPLTVTPSEDGLDLPGHELSTASPETVFTFLLDTQGEITVKDEDSELVIPITPISA